jgi:hypothetical protein
MLFSRKRKKWAESACSFFKKKPLGAIGNAQANIFAEVLKTKTRHTIEVAERNQMCNGIVMIATDELFEFLRFWRFNLHTTNRTFGGVSRVFFCRQNRAADNNRRNLRPQTHHCTVALSALAFIFRQGMMVLFAIRQLPFSSQASRSGLRFRIGIFILAFVTFRIIVCRIIHRLVVCRCFSGTCDFCREFDRYIRQITNTFNDRFLSSHDLSANSQEISVHG